MKANIKKEEPRCAQMTIFYDGKVIVFDDVPADKAKDIMVFSSKGITSTSQNHNNNYAYSSFLARNSANNSLQDCYQVPSIPVIYGNSFGYIMFERVLDLCHGFVLCVLLINEFSFYVFRFTND